MQILVGIDTETTGLKQEDGDRLVEVACVKATWDGSVITTVDTWVHRINPERIIPDVVINIHGITNAMVAGCPNWKTLAPSFLEFIKGANYLVAHNANFDGPFLAGELIRVGHMPPATPMFCTAANGRWATPDGKVPKLQELSFACGFEYDLTKAHGALYDIELTMQCLAQGLSYGAYQLP